MPDENADSSLHHPVPRMMTLPGWMFEQENMCLFRFIGYVSNLALRTDENARVAAKALYEDEHPEKYREMMDSIKKHGATSVLRKQHRTLLFEMMLCRAVDNLLTYVAGLLAIVFCTRPETLRSSEKVRLDAILAHATMDDLIHDLAERRVNELSYRGMRALSTYLAERLDFELFSEPGNLEQAIRIIESRNVIVHSRGVVNKLFLSRVTSTSEREGKRLGLSVDSVFSDLAFIARSVYDMDTRGAAKFTLETEPDPSPKEDLP